MKLSRRLSGGRTLDIIMGDEAYDRAYRNADFKALLNKDYPDRWDLGRLLDLLLDGRGWRPGGHDLEEHPRGNERGAARLLMPQAFFRRLGTRAS